MLRSILILSFCISTLGVHAASDPYFHTVEVKSGDGVFSLLRRYRLSDNQCNIKAFYRINELGENEHLHTSKEYKLPVYLYTYNGKSIRSTIDNDDWATALRIKEYNEALLERGVRKTHFTSSKILWVPWNEVNCNNEEVLEEKQVAKNPDVIQSTNEVVQPVEPSEKVVANDAPSGEYKHDNIFGKEHSTIKILDNTLEGHVYYIVAGHGGPDSGAQCLTCPNVLCEDEYAYDVSLRLARYFISHGAKTHIIIQDKDDGIRDGQFLKCDSDETCMGNKIPLNQLKRLQQRASAMNRLYKKYKDQGVKVQKAIMIHVDSNSEDMRQDVYFYHHKYSKSSKKLAENMQLTFKEKYNKYQKNRGYTGFVKSRNLYMINYTQPTAVFVELANIRNPHDHKRLVLSSNREALAKWLYEGMIR